MIHRFSFEKSFCAQIGRNVHLSGGVGIGGVLEPPNAVPVVVEDEAMIGSRAMVVEGARVRAGAVLFRGVFRAPGDHGVHGLGGRHVVVRPQRLGDPVPLHAKLLQEFLAFPRRREAAAHVVT